MPLFVIVLVLLLVIDPSSPIFEHEHEHEHDYELGRAITERSWPRPDAPKNRSPSATKAISVITRGSIPGGWRAGAPASSPSPAASRASFVFQKLMAQKRVSEEFFSTGTISSNHAAYAQDCASCHDKGAVLAGDRSFSKFKAVVSDRFHRGIDFTAIDRKCQAVPRKASARGHS